MKYKFISDSHTHSVHSFDGTDSVVMICENAVNLGLYSITITDHCECNEYYEQNVGEAIRVSVLETAKARALYNDKIRIYTGIELGQPTQNPAAARDALSITEFDFVLGSLHNLRGEKDFYFLEYTPQNADALLTRYFEELLALARTDDYDALAHLTYPLRYIIGNAGIKINTEKYANYIDRILTTIIRKNKALEVNTSGLRQVIGKTLPDEAIIRRFKSLGGIYVTIGSDAHRWGDISSGIEDTLALLLECGFSHFTVFEKRRPLLLPVI